MGKKKGSSFWLEVKSTEKKQIHIDHLLTYQTENKNFLETPLS